MAEAAGLTVILHGGGLSHFGQHFTFAMTNTPWAEYFVGSDPGIALEEVAQPNVSVPRDGWIDFAPRGPGFDLGIEADWLEPFVL
jgi:L-rhamnonate dehydratase